MEWGNGTQKELPIIKKNKSIVILSQSWLSQMSRSDLINTDGKRRYVHPTTEDIIKGIHKLKDLIGDSQLVVIGNILGAGKNLDDIFSRPNFLPFSNFNHDKYLITKANKDKQLFNTKLKNAYLASGKFIFLDPFDILCSDNICKNLDSNNRLIYSDAYYLSIYGSIEVVKGFMPELKKIIQKR